MANGKTAPTKPRPSRSPPFHVKQRRGWTPTSICSLQWQAKTNLVASSTLPNLWTRHISDSLQLLALAPDAKIWVDLGSGGGFPGVVLACAMAETPGAMVHLVERNAKKAAFLREALRITGAAGTVHLADIRDSVDSFAGPVDCVTARAVAPLHQLDRLCRAAGGEGRQGAVSQGSRCRG